MQSTRRGRLWRASLAVWWFHCLRTLCFLLCRSRRRFWSAGLAVRWFHCLPLLCLLLCPCSIHSSIWVYRPGRPRPTRLPVSALPALLLIPGCSALIWRPIPGLTPAPILSIIPTLVVLWLLLVSTMLVVVVWLLLLLFLTVPRLFTVPRLCAASIFIFRLRFRHPPPVFWLAVGPCPRLELTSNSKENGWRQTTGEECWQVSATLCADRVAFQGICLHTSGAIHALLPLFKPFVEGLASALHAGLIHEP